MGQVVHTSRGCAHRTSACECMPPMEQLLRPSVSAARSVLVALQALVSLLLPSPCPSPPTGHSQTCPQSWSADQQQSLPSAAVEQGRGGGRDTHTEGGAHVNTDTHTLECLCCLMS